MEPDEPMIQVDMDLVLDWATVNYPRSNLNFAQKMALYVEQVMGRKLPYRDSLLDGAILDEGVVHRKTGSHPGVSAPHNTSPENMFTSLPKVSPNVDVSSDLHRAIAEKGCPTCGSLLFNFALCGQCADYKKGYRYKYVCPNSAGMDERTSDSSMARTYRQMLTSMKVALPETITCKQETILVQDGA